MNSITTTLCLDTQLSSTTKSGYLSCVMESQNIFWTILMSTIDSINILHIFCRTLYTVSIVVSHIPSLFVYLLLRRLFYLPERLQSKSIIWASKNWRQMNWQIVILVAFDRQISRSIALVFCPVLSRSLPGDCKFLLIFTRYPVRKPNVDSRKSPGEKKEKSKVFERSQRFLRRGGWPRDKWSRISMRLLWSLREACVLETIPPRLPTWTLAPCRLWVIPLMVLLWKEQEKDGRGSKTRID